MNEFEHSTRINNLLAQVKAREPKAREELIAHSLERLQRLSRKMFRKYPNLCTLEQTDDIVQKLVIKLHKMLDELVPEDTAGYFKLASQNLRWVLQDLARSNIAKNKNSGDMSTSVKRNELLNTKDPDGGPSSYAEWSEFYEKIELLPEENKQLFDLLWFQGLSQVEAAKFLKIPLRTLRRRWMITRILIRTLIKNQPPEHGDK
jgi:RNA polymerase sigma factor (sigma-70 family)